MQQDSATSELNCLRWLIRRGVELLCTYVIPVTGRDYYNGNLACVREHGLILYNCDSKKLN